MQMILNSAGAFLKCLGKYIEGSGLDSALRKVDIYETATMRQIIEGHHIH